MQFKKVCRFLYAVSALCIFAFVVCILVDIFKYDAVNNSAPFYVFIVQRVVVFLIPSIFFFLIGRLLKKAYK